MNTKRLVSLLVAFLLLACHDTVKRGDDGDEDTAEDTTVTDTSTEVPDVPPDGDEDTAGDTTVTDTEETSDPVEDLPPDTVGTPCETDEECDDGVWCNGEEYCHPAGECRRAPVTDCGDGDDCTIDTCNESTDSCDHELIDGDGDTYPPESCGGPDCDDTDATINPDGTEVCGDGIDQDCDGADDSDGDCTCPHYLTLPSEFSSDTGGMGSSHDGSCVTSGGAPESVHRFDLTSTAEVLIDIAEERWYDAVVYIRETTCDGTEVDCFADTELPVRLTLSAGTYFVFVDGDDGGEDGTYWLDVTTCEAPSTTVTGNDDCSSAYALTADGSYGGNNTSLTDTEDPSTCAGWSDDAGLDVWFTFTLSSAATIHLDTNCSEYDTVLYILEDSCTGAEVECNDDGGLSAASEIDASLASGTYYVALDGYDVSDVGDYVLNVSGL